jgi:hypothetical protein
MAVQVNQATYDEIVALHANAEDMVGAWEASRVDAVERKVSAQSRLDSLTAILADLEVVAE